MGIRTRFELGQLLPRLQHVSERAPLGFPIGSQRKQYVYFLFHKVLRRIGCGRNLFATYRKVASNLFICSHLGEEAVRPGRISFVPAVASERVLGRQADRQADRQIGSTGRKAGSQTDRDRTASQTGRQTTRLCNGQLFEMANVDIADPAAIPALEFTTYNPQY